MVSLPLPFGCCCCLLLLILLLPCFGLGSRGATQLWSPAIRKDGSWDQRGGMPTLPSAAPLVVAGTPEGIDVFSPTQLAPSSALSLVRPTRSICQHLIKEAKTERAFFSSSSFPKKLPPGENILPSHTRSAKKSPTGLPCLASHRIASRRTHTGLEYPAGSSAPAFPSPTQQPGPVSYSDCGEATVAVSCIKLPCPPLAPAPRRGAVNAGSNRTRTASGGLG